MQEATTFEDFERTVQELTEELTAEARQTGGPGSRRTQPAPSALARQPVARRGRGGRQNTAHRYDPQAASRIQKLYRSNRAKAVREILDGPSPFCTIPGEELHRHYTNIFDRTNRPVAQPPENLPRLPRLESHTGLERDFTPAEVSARLQRAKNTAPGKDSIRYSLLRKRDPGCWVLAAIFNSCKRFRRTPSAWKKAMTVLIYKKGDRTDPSNWRPISLCSTLYKMYASCIAARITDWALVGNAISKQQKGFMSCEGCYEHNFLLQTILDTVRRSRRQCAVAWLDLSNAFGSIPHEHIFETLAQFGMPETFLSLVRELYEGCSTTVRAAEGETAEISIRSGVKQGCPLSPIIFNLAMEPLLRCIANGPGGFNLYDRKVSVLAYADDLVLIAETPEELQNMLATASTAADWMGLTFNATKCASLHVDGSLKDRVLPSVFSIQGAPMTHLSDGETYQHLGTPTGFRAQQTPEATIQAILEDAGKIDTSLLAPWQKIDALRTFLLSRINFVLRGSAVPKVPLNKADRTITAMLKRWLSLPKRATNDILRVPQRQGGAGISKMGDLRDIAVVTHAFRLLTCPDGTVKTVAHEALRTAAKRKLAREPSKEDLASYLSGSLEDEFGRDGGDFATLWTRARIATRRLNKKIGCQWMWDPATGQPNICLSRKDPPQLNIFSASNRGSLEGALKVNTREKYAQDLRRKPDQGKVFEVTSQWDDSNHFMARGDFTRFADWRFIHRARLNVVPLNGAIKSGNRDKRCRRCGHPNETLPHVICNCQPHSTAWKHRHDAVMQRLANAIPASKGTISLNRTVPGTGSQLRPDIVIRDEDKKRIIMVDVTIPFENRRQAMTEARDRKHQKYAPLADALRQRGYEVSVHAFLVGALGAWDPQNEHVLRACGVSRRYAKLMRRLMVSDTIRWSRDIYIEHISGHRQYQEPPRPPNPRMEGHNRPASPTQEGRGH